MGRPMSLSPPAGLKASRLSEFSFWAEYLEQYFKGVTRSDFFLAIRKERKKERIAENSIAQDFSPKVFGIGKADRSVPSMVDRRKRLFAKFSALLSSLLPGYRV